MQRFSKASMQRCAGRSWLQSHRVRSTPLRSRSFICSASSHKSVVAPAPEQGYIDQVKGRRFSCTECGKCCTGPGEVWIDATDLTRLADRLNIRTEVFLSRYTKSYSRKPGFWLLRSHRNPTQDCIFLKDGLCSVHDVKPLQCTTYPWWPDLMGQADWELEREQTCEGLDHADAQECDAVQAATQLKAATEFFARRDASKPTKRDKQAGASATAES